FTATLGAINTAIGADGILSKDQLTAVVTVTRSFRDQPEHLGDSQPALKDSSTGDVIDFYGPCNEDPVGTDQVQEQKLKPSID
ncbi:MAG TPA: hypothetical protein VFN58_02380, partial [Candidatus Binatia bacterium]|nr:hypothetical protein [Candidatus Binatia bacterium]